jgi:DNA-binding transcriptional LysR family regulator
MLNETDLSRADLNLLVLFEIVLEARHVGRAAERLNLSPSAVSHGLKRLRRLFNDPLFLRTPKGVVPTARAAELAEPIAEALARVRSVIATAEPFDAAKSTRRFTIGAPDGVSAVFLRPLLAELRRRAPGIDIGVRQLLPPQGGTTIGRAWEPVLADLEARTIDIAVAPMDDVRRGSSRAPSTKRTSSLRCAQDIHLHAPRRSIGTAAWSIWSSRSPAIRTASLTRRSRSTADPAGLR